MRKRRQPTTSRRAKRRKIAKKTEGDAENEVLRGASEELPPSQTKQKQSQQEIRVASGGTSKSHESSSDSDVDLDDQTASTVVSDNELDSQSEGFVDSQSGIVASRSSVKMRQRAGTTANSRSDDGADSDGHMSNLSSSGTEEDVNAEEDGFESISNMSDATDDELDLLSEEAEEQSARQVMLTADDFTYIMEQACTSRDGSEIKQLITLAKSLLRSLLSPSAALKGSKQTAHKSSKQSDTRQAEKAQSLKSASAKIESMKKTAPYIFDEDIGEIGHHLNRIATSLEETLAGLDPKERSSFNSLFVGLWRDLIIFMKNRGARDTVSREVIGGLGPCLMRSLFYKTKLLLPFYHRFVEVCLRSDPTESRCMTQLKLFFTVGADRLEILRTQVAGTGRKKKANRGFNDYKFLRKSLQTAFRRLMNAFGVAAMTKRLGQKALTILRLTALVILDVIDVLRSKACTDVYYEPLKALVDKIEFELARDVDTKKVSKLKKKGAYKINYDIYTWRVFFDLFVVILVMKKERGEEDNASEIRTQDKSTTSRKTAHLVCNLSTNIFKILTLLARRSGGTYEKLPFALKCISLLLLMSRTLRTFQPIGILMLKLGMLLQNSETKAMKKSQAAKLPKPVDLRNILFIQKEELGSLKIREGLYEQYIAQLTEFCALLARHPAFPEQSPILTRNIRQIAKNTEEPSYRGKLKQLVEAIEKTSREVQAERAKLKLSELPSTLFIFSDQVWSKFALAPIAKKSKTCDFWDINIGSKQTV